MQAKLTTDKRGLFKDKQVYGLKGDVVEILSTKEQIEDESINCLIVKGKFGNFTVLKNELRYD